MIENIKTAILWILILSSITLTWLVWTYQPEYDVMEEPSESYVEIEDLGETRSISEVLMPAHIVIHNEEEGLSLIHPMDGLYKDITETLQDVEIDHIYPRGSSQAPSIDHTYSGLEIIFDTPLEGEWLDNYLSMEEDNLSISQIDRIILVENSPASSGTEVVVQFIDMEEENVYEATTSFTLDQLNELYETTEEHQTAVEKHVFRGSTDNDFQEVRYMPVEPITMRKYTHDLANLSPQSFMQILFAEPEFVESLSQSGNEETYTDGSRMMNLLEGETIMNFVRPDGRGGSSDSSPHIIDNGLDFINAHSGWTNDFYVDEWHETDQDDRVEFRLHVGGYPILGSNLNMEEHYMIDIISSGGTITEYTRPMYQLSDEPLETDASVRLPSFEQVREHIRENEAFSNRAVQDMRIGHYMVRQRAFATFEPAWYAKIDGRWTHLDISMDRDQEVAANGLE